MIRKAWIDNGDALPVVQQCALAGVSRATIYARQQPHDTDADDLLFSRLIDEEYTRHPFYGSRKMVVYLTQVGHTVNRKRVQRLMRQMGLVSMAPGPNTSRPHPEHKVYPYLLRGVPVVRPNQVWSTDITYIRLAHGFAYLVAIIDWYSRRVLSWRISNSMEAAFCVDCLEDALRLYGKPEIFNSDQVLRPGQIQPPRSTLFQDKTKGVSRPVFGGTRPFCNAGQWWDYFSLAGGDNHGRSGSYRFC